MMQRKGTKQKDTLRFLQLSARISQLERDITKLFAYLGIDHSVLPDSKEGIEALHQEAQQLSRNKEFPLGADMQKWLILFSEISCDYLSLISEYTGDLSPWVPYLEISGLIDKALKEKPELRLYASFAKKNLQNAAFCTASKLHKDLQVETVPPEEFCEKIAKTLFCLWDISATTDSKAQDNT